MSKSLKFTFPFISRSRTLHPQLKTNRNTKKKSLRNPRTLSQTDTEPHFQATSKSVSTSTYFSCFNSSRGSQGSRTLPSGIFITSQQRLPKPPKRAFTQLDLVSLRCIWDEKWLNVKCLMQSHLPINSHTFNGLLPKIKRWFGRILQVAGRHCALCRLTSSRRVLFSHPSIHWTIESNNPQIGH